MSKQQQLELTATLRQVPLDLQPDLATLRGVFNDVSTFLKKQFAATQLGKESG